MQSSIRILALKAAAAAVLFGVVAGAAQADVMRTYDLAWSGVSYGNSAMATGQITLDLTTLPNPETVATTDIYADIVSLTVTVTGSGAGNGTWTKADLAPISGLGTYTYWGTGNGALDMTMELVGQPAISGTWGTPAAGGDFNLFFGNGGPVGDDFFTLSTSTNDDILLTSFAPVPEPLTLTLFGAGLGFAGAMRRRRRKAA